MTPKLFNFPFLVDTYFHSVAAFSIAYTVEEARENILSKILEDDLEFMVNQLDEIKDSLYSYEEYELAVGTTDYSWTDR